jgi:hypothetical protein
MLMKKPGAPGFFIVAPWDSEDRQPKKKTPR